MSDEFAETVALLEAIPGGREMLHALGGAPNFGDAEITCLHLDREGSSVLKIETVGRHPGVVTFTFDRWIDVSLRGFSCQNVIGGLKLRPAKARAVTPWEQGVGFVQADIEMVLEPCFGVNGSIEARIIRVDFRPIPLRGPTHAPLVVE